jgi:hypothetical protein
MHVFGHDDESGHVEPVPAAYFFQRHNKGVADVRGSQRWRAVITTGGNEMDVTRLLISLQSPRHGDEITFLWELSL